MPLFFEIVLVESIASFPVFLYQKTVSLLSTVEGVEYRAINSTHGGKKWDIE